MSMDKSAFVKYEDMVKLLEENSYYGLTVKRVDNKHRRFIRKFASIKWYTIDIEVETLKIDGDNIIIGTKFNGEEINGFDNFRRKLACIGREHHQRKKQEGL